MKWSIPEKVIERGRVYLNSGRVLSVEPDYQKKVWHGEVLGSELYYVSLDGTAKEEDFCQCPYWQEHQYCKHTVAVELYLRKEGISRVMKATDQKTTVVSQSEMFTKGFARIPLVEEKIGTPLAVEFHIDMIETNPYHTELAVLGVQLKVGYLAQNRFYVVKNIAEFLQAWHEERDFELNKQTLSLTHQAFDEGTSEVLQQLYGNSQSQQLLGSHGLLVNGKIDKRTLLLPVEHGQSLLMKINELRRLSFKVGEKTWHKISFSNGKSPLEFSVTKNNAIYELGINQLFTRYFSHYQWGFLEGVFYQLSHSQQEIYLTLQQLMKRFKENVIIYSAEELPALFKEVLPYLRQIGTIQIAPAVTDEIEELPLEATMIFRRKSTNIAVQVNFKYGENIYSTDSSKEQINETKKIILRDNRREKLLTDTFLKLGFTETPIGFTKPIPKEEALYRFFTKEVPMFRRLGVVQMGKKLRSLFLDAQHFQPTIEVRESDSWLDVHFDITGISENEIDQVLQSLMDKQAFYTLESGQILSLDSEEFQQTSQFLAQIRGDLKTADGTLYLPKSQSLQLKAESAGTDVQFTTSFENLTNDLIHPEGFAADVPEGILADLREYQVVGFRWLKMLSHYHFGGILADEMGLGKTLQTITFLLSEKLDKKFIRAVIVAPASLIYNWQAEIKKFAPSLQSCVVSGSKEDREKQLAEASDIYITSYAGLRQDYETYQKMAVDYLILDEAQMVKNSGTKTAQALRELKIPHCFALSGTPIENSLEELWSLFQIVMPGFFPGKAKFRTMDKKVIAQMIRPFVLRRDKKTVLKDLPEKIETNLYSALTDEQKKVYLANLRQMQESINSMDRATFQKNRIGILAGLTRLRQICCDPRLFIDGYEGGSGKLDQVKELVMTAKENNRRILLFSQFTSMLSIIEEEFHELGLTTFYLRGSTKPKDRIDMVNSFNAGEKDVFLISLKAGGTGLNLTGADTVILYDLWWNPAVEEQAAGRAHRIGQKNVVEVWRMIAEGTIEERMNVLQKGKKELFQQVIEGDEEQLHRLTEDDVRMILSIGEEG